QDGILLSSMMPGIIVGILEVCKSFCFTIRSSSARMAAEGRTVKVSGLPVHMPENRLVDKIHIHFLRKRNGGGEISSVTVSKSSPGIALITFEESRVALKLAKRGKQVFKVNEKDYDITISLHHEEVAPDEVILHMSVIVDYSKLPEGKTTLLSLLEKFPGVGLHFDPQKDHCTLSGYYTEVQSLSKLVLGSLESQNSADGVTSRKKSPEMYYVPLERTDNTAEANKADEGATNAPHTQELDLEMESTVTKRGTELYDYSSSIQPGSHEDVMEDKGDLQPDDETSFEDFSLVVDSDIFRYLHKYCTKEYQSILRRHRVEVLDVTYQDITTLYFKPQKTLSQRGMGSVIKAHQDLANLYQEKESQLRKENIPKSGFPKKDLEHALDGLKQRLPKLMIDEDEGNVYLVGSKSDVSEAKQFIVDVKGIRMDKDTNPDPFSPLPSSFTSHQGSSLSSELPEHSSHFRTKGTKFQDSDYLFDSRKVYQKANGEEIFNPNEITPNPSELRHLDGPPHLDLFTVPTQTQAMTDKDMYSAGSNDDTVEVRPLRRMEFGGLYDKDKYTDSVSLFPKSSPMFSSLDLNRKPLDLFSKETKLQFQPDTTTDSVQKQTSGKGNKTKRAESGREVKIAANFSQERFSDVASDTNMAETPKAVAKLDEGMAVNDRMFPDRRPPFSPPFIKPSLNSNLKPNTMPGNLGAKGSVLSKMDTQIHKDLKKPGQFPSHWAEKKPAMMPAYSTDYPSSSLGHMDLWGDTGVSKNLTMPSGSSRRRSNSFSGRSQVRTGKDESPAVDLFDGQKGRSPVSETKKVFSVDMHVSMRLWLYLKTVHATEIDNLTSDLQIRETYEKEDAVLCLRGADSEKVNECHRELKSLINTVEMDFETRTLPLSMYGVSDSKEKTLVDFCKIMKQLHKTVKIIVIANSLIIMGPVSTCQKVEATMMEVFHSGVIGAKAKMESWMSHSPSGHEASATTSDSDRPTPTGERVQSITKNDLPNMSDQSNGKTSKKHSQSLEDRTRGKTLEAVNKDNQEQDNKVKMERTHRSDQMGHHLKGQLYEDGTTKKGNVKTDNLNNSDDEAEAKADGDHKTTAASQKHTDEEGNSRTKETVPGPGRLGDSVDQGINVPYLPGDVKVTGTALPSSARGNQGPLLTCACGAQDGSVNKTLCGMKLCSQCLKEAHDNCKLCKPETKQDTGGIRGTMSVRESTISIPGFQRFSTLKIVYDIPDGFQGEGHPCPGAPFKGNRFEAFLPLNTDTKKLLPLLEKAFQKGLTFTVKARHSEDQGKERGGEGQVVWGNIPHKTRTEGGTSNPSHLKKRLLT
ncbi:hypothetical protein NFI96_014367, partial [Prochilodus magdalenae]